MARKRKPARLRQSLAAADFKARCLELMDRVRETGAEYTITKHGRPVARLVPCVDTERNALFGSGKGTVLALHEPFDPVDADWTLDET
jgi:prevent-host-death family protein